MSRAEPLFDDLYREVILDHYRRPRNAGALDAPTHRAEGLNPLCGDEVALDLAVEGDVIGAAAFRGRGCSISQSSASMMTERILGATLAETRRLTELFEAQLTGEGEPDPALGDLEALSGVAQFPVRVKCALLCWKVLREALASGDHRQQGETA